MNQQKKLLNLKLELYRLLNELDESGTDLSMIDSEILFQLQNDEKIEALTQMAQ